MVESKPKAEPATVSKRQVAALHAKLTRFLGGQERWKRELDGVLRTIRSRRWTAFLFGGAVREVFLQGSRSCPRDLDLVLDTRSFEEFRTHYHPFILGQNRFGGLKLNLGGLTFDVWPLEQTWAFAAHPGAEPWAGSKIDFAHLPRTTFLNIDAVAVRIGGRGGSHRARLVQHGFFDAMLNKVLDINFTDNPYPDLCAVRSLYYAERFGFGISKRLAVYLRQQLEGCGIPALTAAQSRHYGRVLFDEGYLQRLLSILPMNPDRDFQAGELFPQRSEQMDLSNQFTACWITPHHGSARAVQGSDQTSNRVFYPEEESVASPLRMPKTRRRPSSQHHPTDECIPWESALWLLDVQDKVTNGRRRAGISNQHLKPGRKDSRRSGPETSL